MFVPSEKIVVLEFLVICHLYNIIIELSQHEKICESEMIAHEKGS